MIEIIAVIFTLLSVYLTIKIKIINWPVGIIGILGYAILFFQQHLYAQLVLQVIFILQSIYGWIYWQRDKYNKVIFIEPVKMIIHIIIIMILTPILSFFLKEYTNNPQPELDAVTTLLSLLATWYMAKKIIYNWLIWLLTDFFFVVMFMKQHMYWSVALYLFFIFLVIKGLIQWAKSITTD